MPYLDNEPTVSEHVLTPRFEGCNIMTWIGFKHVMYLAEEAILEHFRRIGLAPRSLFEKYGLCFEIVESNARILHALHLDDLVHAQIKPVGKATDDGLFYSVQLFVLRDEKRVKAYAGKIRVVFRRDASLGFPPSDVSPPIPKRFIVSEISRNPDLWRKPVSMTRSREAGATDHSLDSLRGANRNALVWKWHIPYFYCHYNERLQMSGYLRLMEEAEDLFLAERGLSIWTMLRARGWIPVVPTVKLQILRDAYMEEPLHVVYALEEITKDVTYTCRMDCYVARGGSLLHTSTGSITHGYAAIENRQAWRLTQLDEQTLVALRGDRR